MPDENDLQRSLSAASKPAKTAATKVPKRDEVLAPDAQSPKSITASTAPPRPAISNVAKAAMPTQHKAAAVKAAEIADQFSCDTAMRLAFVGAGQGGGKIAQAFWNIGYRRVSAFNTTDSDFAGLDPEMPKMSLDIGGAAKDMQMARNAMRGRDEEVRDLFSRGWGKKFDCAIVCVGLGGGSGSGAALPLVELARKFMEGENLPVRVGAIVALPSVDEGQQAARNAVTAFHELHAAGVSPLIIIDNDKVDDLYRPPMSRLLPMSNELVSSLLHLFNQLPVSPNFSGKKVRNPTGRTFLEKFTCVLPLMSKKIHWIGKM